MAVKAEQIEEVAKSWTRLYYLPEESEERERLFWAYDRLCELVRSEPEEAWKIIEAIRRLDGSDTILSNLAAGPLEDLLVAHGADFIARFEALAEKDEQFRKLLGATWQNAMPQWLWDRVKAAAGPSW